MTANFNNNYSRYYDLLYKDKDYEREAAYVARQVRSIKPKAKSLLELGSGTANHASLLCKEGFTITGIERSEEMAKESERKEIPGFTPLVADISLFEAGQKFDGAIALFHVLSYLTTNESLISCFETTHRHLNKEGLFMFDVWYTPAVYFQKPETRIKKMENEDWDITRLAEAEILYNENVVNVNYEIILRNKATSQTEIYKEKHPMRHFSIPEIGFLARSTGFKMLKAEEFQTGNTPGPGTWGVCFILQKQ